MGFGLVFIGVAPKMLGDSGADSRLLRSLEAAVAIGVAGEGTDGVAGELRLLRTS